MEGANENYIEKFQKADIILGLSKENFLTYAKELNVIESNIREYRKISNGELNNSKILILSEYKKLIKLDNATKKSIIDQTNNTKKYYELSNAQKEEINEIFKLLLNRLSEDLLRSEEKQSLIMFTQSFFNYLNSKEEMNEELKRIKPKIGDVYFVDFLFGFADEMSYGHPFLVLGVKDDYIFGIPATTSKKYHSENLKYSYVIRSLDENLKLWEKGVIDEPKNRRKNKNNVSKTSYFQVNKPTSLHKSRLMKNENKPEKPYEPYTKFTSNYKHYIELRKAVFETYFEQERSLIERDTRIRRRIIRILETLIRFLNKF